MHNQVFQFKLCVSPPTDLDKLTPAQLRDLVTMLLAKMAGLGQKVIEVRCADSGAHRHRRRDLGSIHAHDFLRDAVVLSDDAGQFEVGRHAPC